MKKLKKFLKSKKGKVFVVGTILGGLTAVGVLTPEQAANLMAMFGL